MKISVKVYARPWRRLFIWSEEKKISDDIYARARQDKDRVQFEADW